jgi:hypothetical protein
MSHDRDGAPLGRGEACGLVAAAVVDDDDAIDPRGHPAHGLADEAGLVARGDDDDDGAAAEHGATYVFSAAGRNGMRRVVTDAPATVPEAEQPRARRRWIAGLAALAAAIALVAIGLAARMPPDTTPEGAYLRVAASLGRGDARVVFSYLEDEAQHSAYTIRDYRKRASERVEASYPEPERSRLLEEWRPHATAPDGADVWVDLATRNGWIARLRRDLSAVAEVEIQGDRATVETARGTRYALRRRANGMWGLTMFTAALVAEAERAARDLDVVQASASDFDRAKSP